VGVRRVKDSNGTTDGLSGKHDPRRILGGKVDYIVAMTGFVSIPPVRYRHRLIIVIMNSQVMGG
jgi:hypothetical protein